jgi:Uma2 family endonuclease
MLKPKPTTTLPERYRFSVQEYDQMIKAGVFAEDDRLELIEGEIIPMSPINPDHAGHVDRLAEVFQAQVRGKALVRVQNPVELPRSEPQPDLALVRRRADYYTKSHPKPKDVLLLVEVADTSADYDRSVKIPLYARVGIPETWLVDLTEKQVEIYREPSASGYKEKRTAGLKESLSPLALPNVSVKVREILGAG